MAWGGENKDKWAKSIPPHLTGTLLERSRSGDAHADADAGPEGKIAGHILRFTVDAAKCLKERSMWMRMSAVCVCVCMWSFNTCHLFISSLSSHIVELLLLFFMSTLEEGDPWDRQSSRKEGETRFLPSMASLATGAIGGLLHPHPVSWFLFGVTCHTSFYHLVFPFFFSPSSLCLATCRMGERERVKYHLTFSPFSFITHPAKGKYLCHVKVLTLFFPFFALASFLFLILWGNSIYGGTVTPETRCVFTFSFSSWLDWIHWP